jgi:lycopene cyclase domain-containing protein
MPHPLFLLLLLLLLLLFFLTFLFPLLFHHYFLFLSLLIFNPCLYFFYNFSSPILNSTILNREIWSYPEGRVLGTVGYVPFEEYGFFVIQTFATSLWFLAALERSLLQVGYPAVRCVP